MSLPLPPYDPRKTHTASQGEQQYYPTTRGQMTEDEAKFKRDQLLEFIDDLRVKRQRLLEEAISQLPPTDLKVYYFIGRLNPPHPGHIETLKNLINTAKANGGLFQVVILLGSGPNGGVQTLNDPLPFRLKRQVVIDLLRENGVPDIDDLLHSNQVVIEEMGRAASQISNIIKKIIEINETIIDIQTFRFSGDKDEDMEKLSWIEKSLRDSLKPVVITTNVVGVAAVAVAAIEIENSDIENSDRPVPMSATAVRNYALESYLSKLKNIERKVETGRERDRDIDGLEMFDSEYGKIYTGNTENVYNAIIKQAENFNPEEIQKYIDLKILPGTSGQKGRKKKEGGSKRRKTKNRKLTKRRRLTKRRKSRKHRKSKRRHY
jgi:hypothetical protein